MAGSRFTNTITNYTDFNPVDLKFSKLEESPKSKGQLIGFPRFSINGQASNLQLQLPWITLSTYGVPVINEKSKHYFKTETDRAHIRLPLIESLPEIEILASKFKELDEILSLKETGLQLLGKNYSRYKYKYQPTYRIPQIIIPDESDDEEKDEEKVQQDDNENIIKQNNNKPPYIKIKLDLTWPDNNVNTKVFESVLNTITGKRTRTLVNILTIDDFGSYVCYRSNVRCIIKPFKIWAHSNIRKDPEYGIGWKLIRIEVENVTNIYKQIAESENFIDSDPEIEELETKIISTNINNSTNEIILSDSESDDNEENEENIKL